MNKANELVVNIFISVGNVFTNLVYIRHFTVEYTIRELKVIVRSQKYSIQIKMAFLQFTRLTLVNFHIYITKIT